MNLFVVNTIVFICILFLFVILSWVWPPDSPWAPFWKTSKKIARKIGELAKINSKDIVYELGSGDATTLLVLSKEFGAKCIGVEIDPMRHLIAKLKKKLNGNPTNLNLVKNNFFNVDLSDATIIYVYLVPKALQRLMPKFKKELKTGTKIISYRYQIDLPHFQKDEKNKIFIYKF